MKCFLCFVLDVLMAQRSIWYRAITATAERTDGGLWTVEQVIEMMLSVSD